MGQLEPNGSAVVGRARDRKAAGFLSMDRRDWKRGAEAVYTYCRMVARAARVAGDGRCSHYFLAHAEGVTRESGYRNLGANARRTGIVPGD